MPEITPEVVVEPEVVPEFWTTTWTFITDVAPCSLVTSCLTHS